LFNHFAAIVGQSLVPAIVTERQTQMPQTDEM
jgi:hypothetical protein